MRKVRKWLTGIKLNGLSPKEYYENRFKLLVEDFKINREKILKITN